MIERIPNSHLLRYGCERCFAPVLTVEEHLPDARCGDCLRATESAEIAETVGEVALGAYGPVRRRWEVSDTDEDVADGETVIYPAPQYVSELMPWLGQAPDLDGIAMPPPACSLAEAGRLAGWQVRVQYSRGHFPHSTTGRPGALKHVIGLAFGQHPAGHGREGFACYSKSVNVLTGGWGWGTFLVRGPALAPYAGMGLASFEGFLGMYALLPDEQTGDWISGLRDRRDTADSAKRNRETKKRKVLSLSKQGVKLEEIYRQLNGYFSLEECVEMIAKAVSRGERTVIGG